MKKLWKVGTVHSIYAGHTYEWSVLAKNWIEAGEKGLALSDKETQADKGFNDVKWVQYEGKVA